MGDVFDRIVNRAATPGWPSATALRLRRLPVYGVPDAADLRGRDPQTGTGGSGSGGTATRRDAPDPGLGPAVPGSPAGPTVLDRPAQDGRQVHDPEPDHGRLSQPARAQRAPLSEPSNVRTDHGDLGDVARPPGVEPSPARSPGGAPGPVLRAAGVLDQDPQPPGAPRGGTVPGAAASDVGRSARPAAADGYESRPQGADLRAGRPLPRTEPPPTRTVTGEELLREHLAPALVDRGVLAAEDATRLAAVDLGPVEVPAGRDVHVHLGNVVVQHAPTPPVPQPHHTTTGPTERGAARPDRVDHADYLDRQRRRWA